MELLDLKTLCDLTGVSPRTVYFYVQQGLLPPAEGAGRGARYTGVHRDRLRLIRQLQDQHLPLAEIRKQLDGLTDDELGALAAGPDVSPQGSRPDELRDVPLPGAEAFLRAETDLSAVARPARVESPPTRERPPGSAADYIRSVLAGQRGAPSAHRADPGQLPTPRQAPPPEPPAHGERSQWERIWLAPDIELHVRRPLSRVMNRKLERLLDLARALMKETT